MDLIPGARWYPAHKADPRVVALYRRHYTWLRYAPWWKDHRRGVVAPGESMVLLTVDGAAVWVWLRNTYPRRDGQTGVCCALFRNEGPSLSSALILEAEELARGRWPGERLFTYVDPRRVKSGVPGWCFIRARWKRVGESKGGLLIFEKRPLRRRLEARDGTGT